MQEKKRPQTWLMPGPPASGLFDDDAPDAAGGMVEVTHGAYSERLPAANMTVAQVRTRFADRLDIHPEATAIVAGEPVDDGTTLRAGQLVTFVRPSGEKGWS